MVTKHPGWVLLATVIGMGIVALPTARLHLALPDDGSGQLSSTKRQAYDLLADSFGPGFNGPLIVTVSAPPTGLKTAVGAVVAQLNTLPQQPKAAPAGASADGTLVWCR